MLSENSRGKRSSGWFYSDDGEEDEDEMLTPDTVAELPRALPIIERDVDSAPWVLNERQTRR